MGKPFWKSTTFWSAFVMLLPTLLGFFGFDLSETEVAALPTKLDAIMELIGFFGVIFGRRRAAGPITLT